MSQPLPIALYTAQQVRDLDQIAIQERGIPGIKLMKSAGRSVFDEINHRWPGAPITVFCGAGNNGGDGYIVAALALESRLPVQLIQLASPEKLTGDAYTAYEYAVSAGVPMTPFSDCLDLHIGITAGGVIVDALLGTGLNGQVREPYAQAIRLINHSGLPVVAVDIPSGLSSDTGAALEAAVEADVTVTFIGLKQGLLTGRGPALCGELVYSDLSVPADIFGGVKHTATRLDRQGLMASFPSRHRDAHKGDFGHVLVLGGDEGFGGAVAMAAEAALRTGAGLVSVATRPEHVSAILARRPELMVKGVASGQELVPLLSSPTVLVVGPGLGQSPWSEQMLQQAVSTGLPMVLDADALNIISGGRVIPNPGNANWVMTPHPGEAARLLGITSSEVQADRFAAVRALHKIFKCAVVLKGAGSLVCTAGDQPVGVCTAGNPGMASGGMGDALSGIIGALLAQGLPSDIALPMGVCLHAEAADRAVASDGERGLLATDLFGPLRQLVNE
ncbi:MAG: NAD(P)H-hydrate dehydratase [Porticoccus sp.]|nr:NAD(P)H-hydrate dehydratase [Porticoccus sp.]